MKVFRVLFISLVALVVFSGWSVAATSGVYVGGFLGIVIPHDSDVNDSFGDSATISYDAGFGIGAVTGYRFGNNYRFEGELSYRAADMDEVEAFGETFSVDGDFDALSLMANFFYDFRSNSKFTPYVGGGVGFTSVEVDLEGGSEDDTVFSYQVAGGVGYSISDSLVLDFSYRYFAGEDADFSGTDVEISSSNIQVGVLFYF